MNSGPRLGLDAGGRPQPITWEQGCAPEAGCGRWRCTGPTRGATVGRLGRGRPQTQLGRPCPARGLRLPLHCAGGRALGRRGSGTEWPRGPLPRGARLLLGSGLKNRRPWARARGVGRALGQPSRRHQAGRCPLPPGSSCRAGAGTDPGRQHGRPGPLVLRGLTAAREGAPGVGAWRGDGRGPICGPSRCEGSCYPRHRPRTSQSSGAGSLPGAGRTWGLSLLCFAMGRPGREASVPTSSARPLGQLAVGVPGNATGNRLVSGWPFPSAERPVAWTEGRSGRRWSPGSLYTVLLAWETPGARSQSSGLRRGRQEAAARREGGLQASGDGAVGWLPREGLGGPGGPAPRTGHVEVLRATSEHPDLGVA